MSKMHKIFNRPANVVNMFIKQRGLCHYCKCEMHLSRLDTHNQPQNYATKDHVIPKSKGGNKIRSGNLVLACSACNFERKDTDYQQFKQMKGASHDNLLII